MADVSRETTTRSDGEKVFGDQRFHIGRVEVITAPEEMSADPQGECKVDLAGAASLFLTENDVGGNSFGEVVHDEAGEYFLRDVRHLFRVERGQSDGVFQFAKGSLDSPAHGVEILDLVRREQVSIQICDDGFVDVVRDSEPDDTQGHGVESVFMQIEEIKR